MILGIAISQASHRGWSCSGIHVMASGRGLISQRRSYGLSPPTRLSSNLMLNGPSAAMRCSRISNLLRLTHSWRHL